MKKTETARASHDAQGNLRLPARTIPVPGTISPEARRTLTAPPTAQFDWPDTTDKAVWKDFVAAADVGLAQMLEQFFGALPPLPCISHRLSHSTLYEITPEPIALCNRQRALLYVHGGGFVMGGGMLAGKVALPFAVASGCRTYSIDYRMPPDHPYPAGLDDAVEAYRHILARHPPDQVGVAGISAGSGLAAAMLLKARDEGLPLPGAAVLLSPEADLTESGDSFETNQDIDVILKRRITGAVRLYADGHDLASPYLSPLFGDFSKGFPPTFLQSGTRDLFLSNTVRFHRALCRAGIPTELHVFEAMPHGGFFGAPEDVELMAEQLRFLDQHLGTSQA